MTAQASRIGRYGDWTPVSMGGADDRRPFYAGTAVTERMARLRRAIHEIRTQWDRYPAFMAELRELMAYSGPAAARDDIAERRAEGYFSSRKDWSAPADHDDFSALRLYTSDAGYRRIFRTINTALRGDTVVDDTRALRAAAFLVETLTIDLFHYRAADPDADNFEGSVYRGMCVGDADLVRFSSLAVAPVADRYLSVPLALVSASTEMDRAVEFAVRESAAQPGSHPVVWRIHVTGLGAELAQTYQRRFPSTVLTSICAVPVHRVSDYPHEKEVLLRGPFFQILRVAPWQPSSGGPALYVVDAVMLNSNRDHISTIASDEGDDRDARELFRVLVNLRRADVCAALAAEYSADDVRLYRSKAVDWRRELANLDQPIGRSPT